MMKITLLMLSIVTFIVPCDGAAAVRRLAPVAGRVACAAAAARPATGFDVCGRRMISGDAADEQTRFMKHLESFSGSGIVSGRERLRLYRAILGKGYFLVGFVTAFIGMGSLGLEAIQTLNSHVYITDLPLVVGLSLIGLGLRTMYKEYQITGWEGMCTLTSKGLGIRPGRWDESDKSGEEDVDKIVIPWTDVKSCRLIDGRLVVTGEFCKVLLRIDSCDLPDAITLRELEVIIKQFMKMAAEASAGSGDTEMIDAR